MKKLLTIVLSVLIISPAFAHDGCRSGCKPPIPAPVPAPTPAPSPAPTPIAVESTSSSNNHARYLLGWAALAAGAYMLIEWGGNKPTAEFGLRVRPVEGP